MQNLLRCKACGFIIKHGGVDVCPACGVPKTAFEPYKTNISEKRQKLMDLHIHPILLHFPQAFTLFALALLIAALIFGEPLGSAFRTTAKVVIMLLPVTVALGFLSGIYDGKIRFKKITAPILRKKILLGSAFIISSMTSAVLMYFAEPTNSLWIIEILLLLLSSILSAVLGKMGASLVESKLPG